MNAGHNDSSIRESRRFSTKEPRLILELREVWGDVSKQISSFEAISLPSLPRHSHLPALSL